MQAPAPARAVATTPQAAPAPINISRASASDVYTAAKNQRSELRNQMAELENTRNDLISKLGDSDTPEAAKVGLSQRLKDVESRISSVDQQLAQADAAVAQAASVPGAIVESRPAQRNDPDPDTLVAIPIVFMIFVLCPLAIAYARRIWKKTPAVATAANREVQDKLARLGEAVESIGLEVERIGEGQRFITKVFTESNSARTLGAGAAPPIPVPERGEHAAVPRVDAR